VSDAPAFRPSEIAAVLAVGVIGVLIAGLQPQLLGAMAAEGRLSAARLGVVATVELLTMGLGAGGAGALVRVDRLRPAGAVAAIVLVAADAVTPLAAGAIIAVRALAGLAEGALIWLAIGFIARTANPGRWAAIYLMAQTFAQLLLAAALAGGVLPFWGSAGGFVLLALTGLIALTLLPWSPRAYAPLESDGPGGFPPLKGMIALAGVLFYLAFIVGVWVYVEPLAREAGIAPGIVAAAVPLSLAMQVAGAGVAAWLAGRVPPLPVILIVSLLDLVILGVFADTPGAGAFLGAVAAFGFLWLFVLPFQVPLVIAADPSRRAAVLIAGAQLIGSSLGPLAASGLVSDSDVRPVLWLGAGCVVVSAVLMGLAGIARNERRIRTTI
jgi:DHA1 family inner membrane transport protein